LQQGSQSLHDNAVSSWKLEKGPEILIYENLLILQNQIVYTFTELAIDINIHTIDYEMRQRKT
jgi:hypothetical protein